MLNRMLINIFTKSYFKSRIYTIAHELGDYVESAWVYKDDKIEMSSQDRYSFYDGSEFTVAYVLIGGKRKRVYKSHGRILYTFREGSWIEYLEDLHEKAKVARKARDKEARDRNALQFMPIDDLDVFGK